MKRREIQQRIKGVFSRNPKGFGFVRREDGGEDVFISPSGVKGALSGDRVLVTIDDDSDRRGPSGHVEKVLERHRQKCVGVFANERGMWGIRPMGRDLPDFLRLKDSAMKEARRICKVGDWLEVELRDEDDRLVCELPQKLPSDGGVTADLNAVAREYGLPSKYDETVEKEAAALLPVELPREDFRKKTVFTCDPMDARDFDDALSIQAGCQKGTVVLGVHIADVACYVPPGAKLDEEARRRGFTSYLPGRTIGMLPDALAADLCSLREGVDRLAHTVFLTVDVATGEVLSGRRCHTLIRSKKRLCYEQVDRLLEREKVTGMTATLKKTILQLDALTARMREWRREHEGFLPMEIPEIRVICAGNPPEVVGLSTPRHGRSGEIIEECMLAANVFVAQELRERKIYGLYRNHAQPDTENLEEFSTMAALILRGRPLNLAKRSKMVAFLKSLGETPVGEVLTMSLLRLLPRADYNTLNKGHYGLGKECYCHFTSPIRRYPDLLTHQQLIAADLKNKDVLKRTAAQKVATRCNELEVKTDQAAFAAEDCLKIRELAREADANGGSLLKEAVVCRVLPSGASIYLRETGLMGFIPVERLGEGIWHLTERGLALSNGRRKVRYGDVVRVRVSQFDAVRGEVSYSLSGVSNLEQ